MPTLLNGQLVGNLEKLSHSSGEPTDVPRKLVNAHCRSDLGPAPIPVPREQVTRTIVGAHVLTDRCPEMIEHFALALMMDVTLKRDALLQPASGYPFGELRRYMLQQWMTPVR